VSTRPGSNVAPVSSVTLASPDTCPTWTIAPPSSTTGGLGVTVSPSKSQSARNTVNRGRSITVVVMRPSMSPDSPFGHRGYYGCPYSSDKHKFRSISITVEA
jgi:hypothetical protein